MFIVEYDGNFENAPQNKFKDDIRGPMVKARGWDISKVKLFWTDKATDPRLIRPDGSGGFKQVKVTRTQVLTDALDDQGDPITDYTILPQNISYADVESDDIAIDDLQAVDVINGCNCLCQC